MKKYSGNLLNKLCLIALIVSLSNNNAYSQKMVSANNYYMFGDTVDKSIIEGIALYKEQIRVGDSALKQFFLLLTNIDGNTKVTISYCNSCPLLNILKSSDRYFKYKKIRVPIVFEFDIMYSRFLKSKSDMPIAFLSGGYIIEFDKNGKVIRVGQEQ